MTMSKHLREYLLHRAKGGYGWIYDYEKHILGDDQDRNRNWMMGHYMGLLSDVVNLVGHDRIMALLSDDMELKSNVAKETPSQITTKCGCRVNAGNATDDQIRVAETMLCDMCFRKLQQRFMGASLHDVELRQQYNEQLLPHLKRMESSYTRIAKALEDILAARTRPSATHD